MLSVSNTTYIDGPSDLVSAALEDPETQLLYDGGTFASIAQVSPGPIAKGTRFRAAFRIIGAIEYECTEYDRGALIEHSATTPLGLARLRFSVTPSGDGTRVVQTISLVPNLMGLLLWPLVMRRMMQDRVQSLNDRLKTYVRATAPQRQR